MSRSGNSENYIDLKSIRSIIDISDVNLFPFYLKEVFKDLIDRTSDTNISFSKSTINKLIFMEYINLPSFISDKLFNSINTQKNGSLSVKEFVTGLHSLYYGSFKQTAATIFNLYDFDNDGLIYKEDIKLLLSYLPLKEDQDRMRSLNQIENMLNEISKCHHMNFKSFLEIIEKTNSEIFMHILCFFYDQRPFQKENIEMCSALSKYKEFLLSNSNSNLQMENLNLGSPHIRIQSSQMTLDNENVNIFTPSRSVLFKPIENISNLFEIDYLNLNEDTQEVKILNIPSNLKQGGSSNSLKIEKEESRKYSEMIRMNNTVNSISTPSTFLRKFTNGIKKLSSFYEKERKSSVVSTASGVHNDYLRRGSGLKLKNLSVLKHSGVIYKYDSSMLFPYYLYICNKDIYYFKNESLTELHGLHCLSNCYIPDISNIGVLIDGKTYFKFEIIFPHKTRSYYTYSFQECLDFYNNLKKAIGYQSFSDCYELENDILGQGKFGIVKSGIHKKSKEKVAIKILSKKQMKEKDTQLVREEIDIMKVCNHPNIVKLLDHYENSEYIFIVMEFLQGGTLAKYLEETPVDELSEYNSAKIAYQIANALDYLHNCGIVHRDLKPENIMIKHYCPYEDFSSLKIMDFGLSKVLGPVEKVTDGFGTLTYVAPEVLTRKPYNKQVDIWSLGVIIFYMLSGVFPFDDDSNDEELIAKKIVFSELKFNHKSWIYRLTSLKVLLKGMLNKDIDKRYKIKDVLSSEWFSECNFTNTRNS